MMKTTPRLLRAGLVSLLLVFLWAAVGLAARGDQPGNAAKPAFKTGELILYCKPGTTQADVNALAASVQATSTTPLLLADCYHLILPVVQKTEAATLAAVAALKPDPRVRWVGPNRLYYAAQTPKTIIPNDPLYPQQWNLPFINMPQAWAILPPPASAVPANVADIDSGFDLKHPDLLNRYLPESQDLADNTSDPSPAGTDFESQHGVFTSGIMIATWQNSIGIAGIAGQPNVLCLGLRAYKTGDPLGAVNGAGIINSLSYILQHKDDLHLVAVNMSFGTDPSTPVDPSDTTDPQYVATKACYDKGIVMVCSAGNQTLDDHLSVPQGYPFVMTVSALTKASTLASYSNFGKIDIAAPGGEVIGNDPAQQIWSTTSFVTPEGYDSESGTSYAAPHVTAVATLLMTVPGVGNLPAVQARDKVIQTLEQTAFHRSDVVPGPIPGPKFGWGFLDAYAALLKVSANVLIEDPVGVDANGNTTDPTGIAPAIETLKPTLRIQVGNVPFDSADLTITIDGTTIPLTDFTVESGVTTGVSPAYVLTYRTYEKAIFPSGGLTEGQHSLTATGTNPTTGAQATDVRRFSVALHQIQTGLSTFSIPYYESPADSPLGNGKLRPLSQILSPSVTLFRSDLNNPTGYDAFTGSTLDQAEFPTDVAAPTQDTANATALPPLGYGYFIKTSTTVKVQTFGAPEAQSDNNSVSYLPFSIPVHEGWNLIGDPFPFVVGYNSLTFETLSTQRLTIQQASDQNLVLPYIYRYNSISGYTPRTLPDGILAPWEAEWIYIVPANPKALNLNTAGYLIVPPTAAAVTQGRSVPLSQSLGLFDHTLKTASLTRQATPAVPTNADGSPRVSGPGSWAVRLTAHANNLSDNSNFVGMSVNGTDGVDRTKVPKPPLPSPFVSVGVTRAETPALLYSQDLRSLGGTKAWNLTVNTDQTDSDVTLNWQNLVAAPRSYRLTLLDTTTNQTIDLRTQSYYRFHTGKTAATRSFVLTARPVSALGRALLTNIFVNPSRSDGRSPSVYQIGYTTSQEVTVDVSILTFSGRLLANVAGTRAVASGDNSAVWTGRDNAGRPVAAGTYVLQLRAVTADGSVTRETRPLIITGR